MIAAAVTVIPREWQPAVTGDRMVKIVFNGAARLATISEAAVRSNGRVFLNTRRDIYSAWKRWAASAEGITYAEPIRGVGGYGGGPDPYFVLLNGWRLQPPNNCETVELEGLLITDDQSPVLAPRPDGRTIPPPLIVDSPSGSALAERGWTAFASTTAALLCFLWWAASQPGEVEPLVAGIVATLAALPATVSFVRAALCRWQRR